MRTGSRSISRSAPVLVVIALVTGILAASCASTRVASSEHPIGASGFPLGSFAKEVRHPDLGHIRLVWTF